MKNGKSLLSVLSNPGEIIVSSQSYEFSDYHRTITGYHGTTLEIADRLVNGEAFNSSNNVDDWFGKGIYFWEYAPKQAWWWAEKFKKMQNPAVVAASIRLGNCFDLLDPENVKILKSFHDVMKLQFRRNKLELPKNARHRRNLDCAVFNFFYNQMEQAQKPIDSARAVYVPTDHTKRIWKGSWIYEEAHIQICIRNPQNILAVWHVKRDGSRGRET